MLDITRLKIITEASMVMCDVIKDIFQIATFTALIDPVGDWLSLTDPVGD